MITNSLKTNECDKCINIKEIKISYVILCLYVDDMLIVKSDNKIIKTTKITLNLKLDMNEIGLIVLILGIIVTRHRKVLSQINHIIRTKSLINLIRMIPMSLDRSLQVVKQVHFYRRMFKQWKNHVRDPIVEYYHRDKTK